MVGIVSSIYGTRYGIATSWKKGGAPIEGQHPWEVAETSAVGRALGMFGYGVLPGTGLTHAEDMQRVLAKEGGRNNPAKSMEERPRQQPTRPVSVLDDDSTYSNLLTLMLEGGEKMGGAPGLPVAFAKHYVDEWKAQPGAYPDKGAIMAAARTLAKLVQRRLVIDLAAVLKDLDIGREEAKKLLGVSHMVDLLDGSGAVPDPTDIKARLLKAISEAE